MNFISNFAEVNVNSGPFPFNGRCVSWWEMSDEDLLKVFFVPMYDGYKPTAKGVIRQKDLVVAWASCAEGYINATAFPSHSVDLPTDQQNAAMELAGLNVVPMKETDWYADVLPLNLSLPFGERLHLMQPWGECIGKR